MNQRDNVQNRLQVNIGDFFVQFSLLIIGLAFGYGIDGLARNFQIAVLARFATLFLVLAIWLHSQMNFSSSDSYWIGQIWYFRLIEYFLELVHIMMPLVAARSLQNEFWFYIWILGAFLSEFLLNGFYLFRLRLEQSDYPQERQISISWLWNGGLVLFFGSVVVYLGFVKPIMSEFSTSIFFFVVILILMLVDYSHNREFYFGISS